MRRVQRVLGVLSALLLAIGLVAPTVGFDGPQISYVTIGSATVDRGGNVRVVGTVWCSQPMDVQFGAQVQQVVGRTVTLRGGFGGWQACNGTTPWEGWARADSGKFTSGWATIDAWFEGAFWCDDPNDPNTCGPHAKGGTSAYMKLVRAR